MKSFSSTSAVESKSSANEVDGSCFSACESTNPLNREAEICCWWGNRDTFPNWTLKCVVNEPFIVFFLSLPLRLILLLLLLNSFLFIHRRKSPTPPSLHWVLSLSGFTAVLKHWELIFLGEREYKKINKKIKNSKLRALSYRLI